MSGPATRAGSGRGGSAAAGRADQHDHPVVLAHAADGIACGVQHVLVIDAVPAAADVPPGGVDPWDGLFPFRYRDRLPEPITIGRRLEGQEGRWRDSYVLRFSKDPHTKVKSYRVETRAG